MTERYAEDNVVLLNQKHGSPTSNIVRITAAYHPSGGSYYVGERVYPETDHRLNGEFNVFPDEIKGHYLGAI